MEGKDPSDQTDPSTALTDAVPAFDPSRMVGIIKRKALIRDLADAYHRECLKYCQDLLELQRKWGKMYYSSAAQKVAQENSRAEVPLRPPKRSKRMRSPPS
ncbi:uncharacterized protein LOC144704140 isoform X2 [Wolffia australiana]